MRANDIIKFGTLNTGYIAGSGEGVVTINGQKASRNIFVFDAVTLTPLQRVQSLINGHYMIRNLDTNKQYIVICRDLPPDGVNQRYEPAVFDYVTPATDLTLQQQQELWQSWQTTT